MRSRVALPLALAAFAAVLAGGQTVADSLRGSAKPLSAADLPEGYRAVSLDSGLGGGSLVGLFGLRGMSTGVDAQSKIVYGLIGATFVDPEEFAAMLDGKRPRVRAYTLDLAATFAGSSDSSRTPAPTFAETWIEAGRIVQWSPRPDLTKAAILAAFAKAGPLAIDSAKSAALSNAKQVALAMTMYEQDYDERLPNADSTAKAQAAVAPYLKNDMVWASKNPVGGRLLFNTSLAKAGLAEIERPAETLLLWDENPWPDGSRTVAFVDGRARTVPQAEWERLWAAELRRRHPAPSTNARPTPR